MFPYGARSLRVLTSGVELASWRSINATSTLGGTTQTHVGTDKLSQVFVIEWKGLGSHTAETLVDPSAQERRSLQSESANAKTNLAAFSFGFVSDHPETETLLVHSEAVLADETETFARSLAEHGDVIEIEGIVTATASTTNFRSHGGSFFLCSVSCEEIAIWGDTTSSSCFTFFVFCKL